MTVSYDSIAENNGILLDLPFTEGIGTVTRDRAKPHHSDVDLINTPTWETIASGLGVLTFDRASQEYLELDTANSLDFNFEGGNYSISAWIRWEDPMTSVNIMGRYELDHSGWEVYLYAGGSGQNYLTQRHHHAGTLVSGNPRSGCYSEGWTPEVWWLFGSSRGGVGEATHYRNGVELPMVTGGLVDPESCAQDFLIGARYTKNADFYNGKMWRPRIWNRALTEADWVNIFEKERDWFGV